MAEHSDSTGSDPYRERVHEVGGLSSWGLSLQTHEMLFSGPNLAFPRLWRLFPRNGIRTRLRWQGLAAQATHRQRRSAAPARERPRRNRHWPAADAASPQTGPLLLGRRIRQCPPIGRFHGRSGPIAIRITLNYRERYGLYASNGILFNHEARRATKLSSCGR